MKNIMTIIGDYWHIFRVALGEDIVALGLMIMPTGPEKSKLDGKVYEYTLWKKDA